ncbi:MAG: hypothetical protein MJ211_05075 [Bacteroidales bacterium]|nr:hypothetical protein [Bacteroidales bacterium]
MNNHLSYLLKLKRSRKLGINSYSTTLIPWMFALALMFFMTLVAIGLALIILQSNNIFYDLTKVFVSLLVVDFSIKCIFSKSSIAELCSLKLLPIPKYELYLQNIKDKLFSFLNFITFPFCIIVVVSLYFYSKLELSHSIILIAFYIIFTLSNTFVIIWIKSLNGLKRNLLLIFAYILVSSIPMIVTSNSNLIPFLSDNLIQNKILLLSISIVLVLFITILAIYQYKNEFTKFLESQFNSNTDSFIYGIVTQFSFSPITKLIIKIIFKNLNFIVSYLAFIIFSFVFFNGIEEKPGLEMFTVFFMLFSSFLYLLMNQTIVNFSICYDGLFVLNKKLIYNINKIDIKINYVFVIIASLCFFLASKDINLALNQLFLGAGLNAYICLYCNNNDIYRFDILKNSLFAGHISNANLKKVFCFFAEVIVFSIIWHFVDYKYIITIMNMLIFIISLIYQEKFINLICDKFNKKRYLYQSIMRGF